MSVKPAVCAVHSESCCSRGGNRRGVEYEQLGRTGTFIQGQDSRPGLVSKHYGVGVGRQQSSGSGVEAAAEVGGWGGERQKRVRAQGVQGQR